MGSGLALLIININYLPVLFIENFPSLKLWIFKFFYLNFSLYDFARVAIKKKQTWCLKQQQPVFSLFHGLRSEIVSQWAGFSEASLLGLLGTLFSLCLPVSPYGCRWPNTLPMRPQSCWSKTTLMSSFNAIISLETLFPSSHILRFWRNTSTHEL